MKQAGPSVYEQFLGPSEAPSHGARVIGGKRMLQSATDIFAGWTSVNGMDFYVRQFRDMKVIPDSERVAQGLAEFAAACGEALGRAHARTGDAAEIAGYLGRGAAFVDAMRSFAVAYADQNNLDHKALAAAIGAGESVDRAGVLTHAHLRLLHGSRARASATRLRRSRTSWPAESDTWIEPFPVRSDRRTISAQNVTQGTTISSCARPARQ